jgi:hypothetical protein
LSPEVVEDEFPVLSKRLRNASLGFGHNRIEVDHSVHDWTI